MRLQSLITILIIVGLCVACHSSESVNDAANHSTAVLDQQNSLDNYQSRADAVLHNPIRGIYVSQPTLENTAFLKRLIHSAKMTGVNTFVIDLTHLTKQYQKNIALVLSSGIQYVVRIVVFPGGASWSQVRNTAFWKKKWPLMKHAIHMGVSMIQLDYIRFKSSTRPSKKNAIAINEVIQWYKKQLKPYNVPLQIDIFGEVSHGPSYYVGQDIKVFANSIDSVSPMLYPSHYEPYRFHGRQPYKTVANSIQRLKAQFNNKPPFSIVPYIETHNYRIRHVHKDLLVYMLRQIQAVEHANVSGWYAWSARNHYANLFLLLNCRQGKVNSNVCGSIKVVQMEETNYGP